MNKKISSLAALVAMAVTVFSVWSAHRVIPTRAATWQDVMKEADLGGYRLITTDEIAKSHLKEGRGLLLVDTRQEWEFRTGHIAGALNFPMAPTRWERWKKARALEAFLGPDKTRSIVFY